jgi:lactoylglutathione lyase
MNVNHMHLGVRDVNRARQFYESYLGFRFKGAIKDDFIFLTNDAGFLLALTVEKPAPFPEWFHFGFLLESATAVKKLHAKMKADGIAVEDIFERENRVCFGVCDPDGSPIEIFWEQLKLAREPVAVS